MDSRRVPPPGPRGPNSQRPGASAPPEAPDPARGSVAEEFFDSRTVVERSLRVAAGALERMRIECERYLNGAEKTPPEEPIAEARRAVRDLRLVAARSPAEQFRIGGLEARFNSLSELYNRRARARDEGRANAARAALGPARRPVFDPRTGIVVDESLDHAAVEALYGSLYRGRAASIDISGFTSYLEKQVESIRVKTGCTSVQFRVAEEDGTARLKARPIGLPRPATPQ